MLNKTIIIMLILSLIPSISFAVQPLKREAESAEKQIKLSDEEYEAKIKRYNTIMIVGGAIAGAGVVATAGASIYMEVKDSEGFAALGDMAVAGPFLVGGIGMMIGGGATLLVGHFKKNSLKKRQFSMTPIVDPTQRSYGLNLSMNF